MSRYKNPLYDINCAIQYYYQHNYTVILYHVEGDFGEYVEHELEVNTKLLQLSTGLPSPSYCTINITI